MAENLIDIQKLVSKEELEALIFMAKSRQNYFKEIFESRRVSREKGEEILETKLSAIDNDKVIDNIKKLTRKLMDAADKKFLEHHKEELSRQSEIVEFLHKFTNEKFVNYLDEIKKF